MANGRNKGADTSRDGGGFAALPWQVLDCSAFFSLSYPAKALLLDIARQLGNSSQNGKLLASSAYLRKRGWTSNSVITRALRELLEAGFIYQTVKGHRPNKASWFALTWYSLGKNTGYDYGAEAGFVRGAYRRKTPQKISSLKPPTGTKHRCIAPDSGIDTSITTPLAGAIGSASGSISTPDNGDHLDMPSACAIRTPNPNLVHHIKPC